VSGSISTRAIAVYGTKGIASVLNSPGSRQNSASWIDSSNNLWLYGGYGYATIAGSPGTKLTNSEII
jgi:hypothetical protein